MTISSADWSRPRRFSDPRVPNIAVDLEQRIGVYLIVNISNQTQAETIITQFSIDLFCNVIYYEDIIIPLSIIECESSYDITVFILENERLPDSLLNQPLDKVLSILDSFVERENDK